MTLRKLFALSCLKKGPTCDQIKITTCIDLTLTNKKNLFKLFDNFESGLLMILCLSTVTSENFKGLPKKKMFRSHKNLDLFNNTLEVELYTIGTLLYTIRR